MRQLKLGIIDGSHDIHVEYIFKLLRVHVYFHQGNLNTIDFKNINHMVTYTCT